MPEQLATEAAMRQALNYAIGGTPKGSIPSHPFTMLSAAITELIDKRAEIERLQEKVRLQGDGYRMLEQVGNRMVDRLEDAEQQLSDLQTQASVMREALPVEQRQCEYFYDPKLSAVIDGSFVTVGRCKLNHGPCHLHAGTTEWQYCHPRKRNREALGEKA